MIYFDNAATSNKKPISVKFSTLIALQKYSANPGRSGHKLSIKTAQKILEARVFTSQFFNCPNFENVVFTKNCTEALNIAILGSCKKYGNVIASCFEHNSVLRPLKHLENDKKISLTIAKPQNKHYITANDILPLIKEDTFLVCVNHISNVTGNKNQIEEIGRLCKEKNILLLVDCAQSAGHTEIDMEKQNISLLTFAGHKGLYAPQSIGGLCINTKNTPKNILFGGTGTNSYDLNQPNIPPECYESGTLSTPLILGLYAGEKYVSKHLGKIKNKIESLTKHLYTQLKNLKDIILYTHESSCFGVVCFNIKNQDSTTISNILDEKYNIATRGGLHCSPLAHEFLGTTKTGAVRISIGFFNTKKQINKLIFAIKEICNSLNK